MLLHPLDILQPQLGLDDLHISERVNITLDVDDLCVVERSDDLENTIDGTDVGQERVTETGTGRGTGGETGDIDAGEEGGDSVDGLVGFAKPVETFVGDGDTGFLG